jgi:hypothetical protein
MRTAVQRAEAMQIVEPRMVLPWIWHLANRKETVVSFQLSACVPGFLMAAGCPSKLQSYDARGDKDFRAARKQFGIRQAEVELHFIWIAGPTFPKPARQIYSTNYGFGSPQITDPKLFGRDRRKRPCERTEILSDRSCPRRSLVRTPGAPSFSSGGLRDGIR